LEDTKSEHGTSASRISTISGVMTNPYAHNSNCDFWFDQYDFECTCGASAPRPAADPVQALRAIRGLRSRN
jgi:hypothetical protein